MGNVLNHGSDNPALLRPVAPRPQDRDVSERLRGSPLVGSHFEDTETQERNLSHLGHLQTPLELTYETGDVNLGVKEVRSASLEKVVANAGNA